MNTQAQIAPVALQISNISIRQDAKGRFCLNDLHKASGNNPKNKPSEWLRNQQTIELIDELSGNSRLGDQIPVETIKGGKTPGTFAIKELVYAYAMWISAKFHIIVIRAYDAQYTARINREADDDMLIVMNRAEFEAILDERLLQLSPPEKFVTYQSRAARPNEVRMIMDINVDEINVQIGKQGFKVVRA